MAVWQRAVVSLPLLLPEILVACITDRRSEVDRVSFSDQGDNSEKLSLVGDYRHFGRSEAIRTQPLFADDRVPGSNGDGLSQLQTHTYEKSINVSNKKIRKPHISQLSLAPSAKSHVQIWTRKFQHRYHRGRLVHCPSACPNEGFGHSRTWRNHCR